MINDFYKITLFIYFILIAAEISPSSQNWLLPISIMAQKTQTVLRNVKAELMGKHW